MSNLNLSDSLRVQNPKFYSFYSDPLEYFLLQDHDGLSRKKTSLQDLLQNNNSLKEFNKTWWKIMLLNYY